MKNTNLTILGSGPGGYKAAIHAAKQGFSITVIERNGIGGVCLRHGCIPVKALIHSARVYEIVRDAELYGVTCFSPGFDFSRMMKRKDDIVAVNEKGIETLFKKYGITLVHGSGKLVSPSCVEIVDRNGGISTIDSDSVIIATGSSSVIPEFITLDGRHIFDCEGALVQKSLPESIVILGGGFLGCEFASLYKSLGVSVTIIEKLPSLLPVWDTDLSHALSRSFKKRSIEIRTDTTVEDVRTDDTSDGVTVSLSSGESVTAANCLVALGRTPNIKNIGLGATGIELWKEERHGIQVNEFMQTNIPSVYAVGDVTGIRLLAHVASAQGITAVEHLCGNAVPMSYDAVPDCCRILPEIASVGITEQEAHEKGLDVRIAKSHYRESGIAHAVGETDGFVKVIAEKGTRKVLGIHICGYSASEMIAEASVIVANSLTVDDVRHTIHAHPTMGEIVKEAVIAIM